eukprot:gene4408-5163_t
MQTSKLLCVLFVSAFIAAVCTAANVKPQYLTLSAVIYDQMPKLNSNFEPDGGDLRTGLVNDNINKATRVPTIRDGISSWTLNQGRIYDVEKFKSFFLPVEGLNKNIQHDLTLKLEKANDKDEGTYVIDVQEMFPIDYKGWDEDPKNRIFEDRRGDYHNFHYCLKLNSYFTYQGTEKFLFRGDDDVWVFINNKLAVDLGGLHSAKEGSVDLRTLGLTIGNTYSFDFFYCERHTPDSTMRIETNIEVFCVTDYCGVCNGDGSSCCSPSTCDDKNSCTIDSCPAANTPGINKDNWKSFCINKPMECAQTSKCQTIGCKDGQCVATGDRECAHQSCKTATCTERLGCQYNDKCVAKDLCEIVTCDATNKDACITKAVDCNKGDLCMDYSCNPTAGCVATPKNCVNDTNPCTSHRCEASTGQCITSIPAEPCDCKCSPNLCQEGSCDLGTGNCILSDRNIDDNNLCTVDECHVSDGTITHTAIPCTGCEQCVGGVCKPVDTVCDDFNVCTVDKCTNTTCTHELINCDDNDPCTIDSCDAVKGCQYAEFVCADEGNCQVGVCTKGVGCGLAPRVCESTNFCNVTMCDEMLGCVNFPRKCVPDNTRCQSGVCNAETQECESEDYDPKPFVCKTAAVVSVGVIAGVTVAAAVAVALAVFGGKKGYDYWKTTQNQKISNSVGNPLYETNPSHGNNPLYANDSNL